MYWSAYGIGLAHSTIFNFCIDVHLDHGPATDIKPLFSNLIYYSLDFLAWYILVFVQ